MKRQYFFCILLIIFSNCINNSEKKNSSKIDTIKLYTENKISKEEVYINDTILSSKSFYDNGKTHIYTIYNEGIISEKYVYYYSGSLMFKYLPIEYVDTGYVYSEEGYLLTKGKYIQTSELDEIILKEVGEHKSYFKNGKVRTIVNFDRNGKNGEFILFYENGNILKKGFYKNYFQDSSWYYYDEKGYLIKEEFYKLDTLLRIKNY